MSFDGKQVARNIAITTIFGATGGLLWASIAGRNKLSHAFYMGTNWFAASVPFFTIRASIISFRTVESESIKDKNRNRWLGSLGSGALLGAGVGLLWNGVGAIVPVAIFHSLLAAGGQFGTTQLDQWRVRQSIDRLEGKVEPKVSSRSWLHRMIKDTSGEFPVREEIEFDPFKTFYEFVQDILRSILPESMTCMTRAVDIEYRRKLTFKVVLLRDQIDELRLKIAKLEQP